MPNLLLPLLTTAAQFAKANFVRQTQHPVAVQERFLRRLLQIQQHTELGRKHHLAEIQTVDQFRDRLPVWSYSDYEPYVDRIAAGETGILTADPVVYLCVSSGTTGKRKRVPLTRRFQNSLQRANLVSIGFGQEGLRRRGLKFGKVLVTNSVQILGRTEAGIEYGLASTGSLRMGKFLFEQTFAHPYEILLIGDSLSRHYVCLLFALRDRQLRGVANNFPMLVLRTCGYLEQFAESLIQDLATGQIAAWLQLEPDVRRRLERQWTAAPRRAAELRTIWQREGRLTPKLAWPELAFVVTARGGTSDFYFQRFPDYFGDTPVSGGVYGCTEATYSISHEFDQDGSVLALESGFFEFIPPDQWQAEQPQTLLPTEVKVGERYRILVTNYSGFYRYDIGDVVEVVGFFNQTPLIVFRYRQGGQLSSTSEKTTEFHAIQVMRSLQQDFGLTLEDFCITLSDQEVPAHYLVNIELSPQAQLGQPQAFLTAFDRQLKQVNHHYQVMRVDQVPPPRLRILAPGSFAIVRERLLQQGMPDPQLKVPHISENRQFLAGLEVQQEVRLPEEEG